MKFQTILFLAFSLVSISVLGFSEKTAVKPAPIDHATWDKLLRQHVKADGFMDYKSLMRDSAELSSYLDLLSSASPDGENWSREEKMAFWINAYNAFTVQLVIRNYPVASIMDIKRPASANSVWDIKFIRIGNKKYTLNDIENNILRPEFKDARIHAAINCASYSCPTLRAEAFTAERLDEQLTSSMRSFVNDPLRNKVSKKKAAVSEIFKWFREDFVQDAGSVRGFLNKYADQKLDSNGRISYLDYRWSLNDVK